MARHQAERQNKGSRGEPEGKQKLKKAKSRVRSEGLVSDLLAEDELSCS